MASKKVITSNVSPYSLDLAAYGSENKEDFEIFAAYHLSEETNVRYMTLKELCGNMSDVTLKEKHILSPILAENARHRYNCLFINRFLLTSKHMPVPADAAKFRVSMLALERIFSAVDVSSAFVYALIQYYLPSGRGYSNVFSSAGFIGSQLWYTLPIRFHVSCIGSPRCHITSNSGSNKMNPLDHLHLPKSTLDISGSLIALSFRYSKNGQSMSMLAVNFVDGRWPETIQEPELRIKEVLGDSHQASLKSDPFFIHLVYVFSATKWWTNSLKTIHDQLIAYESYLQKDEDDQAVSQMSQQDINRALHAMAAHLHRYSSELRSIDDTLAMIMESHRLVMSNECDTPNEAFERIETGFRQVQSQVKAVRDFEEELEKKIQNSLALLFNRIQLSNDRVMVANGAALQAIMEATRQETQVSQGLAVKAHKLTESMKKDSLSMKTIAILTMFFLPGTSFAALLSMPFFNDNDWMKGTSRFWLWIVLTIPSTGLAFAFYFYRQSRNASRLDIGTKIEMTP